MKMVDKKKLRGIIAIIAMIAVGLSGVIGYAIGSNRNTNTTAKVVLKGDLIADGTILGKHIAASQTISAPNIVGGSLNIANKFKVMTNGDVLIQAATGNTGMKLTSERIDVYDTSGKLRVRMGKLT